MAKNLTQLLKIYTTRSSLGYITYSSFGLIGFLGTLDEAKVTDSDIVITLVGVVLSIFVLKLTAKLVGNLKVGNLKSLFGVFIPVFIPATIYFIEELGFMTVKLAITIAPYPVYLTLFIAAFITYKNEYSLRKSFLFSSGILASMFVYSLVLKELRILF